VKNILIIGASSSVAKNCARIWANDKNNFFLIGRNNEKLYSLASDLRVRGSKNVYTQAIKFNEISEYKNFLEEPKKKFQSIDIVLIAHGSLGDQNESEKNLELMLNEINVNAISTISILSILANYFEEKKEGTIVVISSIAGDKGRASNYIYGSAKAMVTTFVSGLRQRLSNKNVSLITIKLGIVDTPMTSKLKKNFLWSSSYSVAKKIVNAVSNNKEEVYVPGFWRIIILIIKLIPNKIFKKMRF
jgi:decaprenylphospho-beta-D-erythro-pentofuranosid-2-ulose 2-reductase